MALPLSSLDPLEPMRPAGAEGDRDDAKSVAAALRATLLFLAIIGFLAWAGAADAQPPGVPHPVATAGAPSG
jgi:hypothetical protein